MPILRIHHAVPSFDTWKAAFDSDPVDRKGGGVRRYQIRRSVPDPHLVMIDLEFDTVAAADAFLQKLKRQWDGPGRAVMQNPQAWIVETIASVELA